MVTRTKKTGAGALYDEEPKGDFQALLRHMQENPLAYAASVIFVVVCGFLGVFYRMYSEENQREIGTRYAKAMELEEPGERAQALGELAASKSVLTPELLYMQGESAYKAEDHNLARAAFERLRSEYPDYEFVSDAVEGLGFISENKKKYQEALAAYEEVLSKWPASPSGLRQPLNIARCKEHLEDYEGAIAAYRDQLSIFPGSNTARRAQEALNRMRLSHGDLFETLDAQAVATPVDTTVPVVPRLGGRGDGDEGDEGGEEGSEPSEEEMASPDEADPGPEEG